MQYKLPTILAAAFLSLNVFSTQAQTVSDFEGLTLPPETDYASTLPADSAYSFESGNAKFYGSTNAWGSFSGFNFSNITDTSNLGFTHDKTAITGKGVDSSNNYGLCFIPVDFMGPNPDKTIPQGISLTGNAIGKKVSGVYITNTTYAYYYMAEPSFATANHWLQLTVRGYLNGVQSTDSVKFMLADFRNNQTVLVDSWEWVALTALGKVDSISFDLSSDDANAYGLIVPAYFAMDNLMTLEDFCDPVSNLTATNITENSVEFNWTIETIDSFEFAIDESTTLTPLDTFTYFTNTDNFTAVNLTANTEYVFHIRRICTDSTASAWDTIHIKTLDANGIQLPSNALSLTVSPNPANDFLWIKTDRKVILTIFNLMGQKLIEVKETDKIDVSNLTPGLYILKAQEMKSGKENTLRFIKQ